MLEKQIEARLVRKVREIGGKAFKFVSPANRGVPDRIVIIPGHIYFVELKTETGKLSALQKENHKWLRSMGFHVYVLWNYENVDEFIDILLEDLNEQQC